MKRRVFSVNTIEQLAVEGQKRLVLARADIVTPAARDRAHELGIELIESDGQPSGVPLWSGAGQDLSRRPLIGRRPEAPSAAPPPSQLAPPSAPAPAGEAIEDRVREIVARVLAQGGATEVATTSATSRGVVHVDGRATAMSPFPFEIRRPEMDVRLQDVITHEQGSPMAAGFMSLHKGSFPWTLDYDEIEYVIEGELHITTAQGVTVGRPGDVIYVPKGTSITFGTPSWAKFLYVTYPAQWAA
jgi:ethanolamine utilization protein EutQ